MSEYSKLIIIYFQINMEYTGKQVYIYIKDNLIFKYCLLCHTCKLNS